MKAETTIYTDCGNKLCTIRSFTNKDGEIVNENRIIFENVILDVIEFNTIVDIYKNIARVI